jgi:hypothetical protein
MQDWFWQLTAGLGPDWQFTASFTPASAAALAALVRKQRLPGFTYHQVVNGPCTRHQHTSTYDLYVDTANAAGLWDNLTLTSRQPRNLWVYHTIEICGADLTLERGYGGYPGAHGATETGLIVRLARAHAVTMTAWEIGYGGQGYPHGHAAAGTSAPELLAYLQVEEQQRTRARRTARIGPT